MAGAPICDGAPFRLSRPVNRARRAQRGAVAVEHLRKGAWNTETGAAWTGRKRVKCQEERVKCQACSD